MGLNETFFNKDMDFDQWFDHYKYKDGYSHKGARDAWYYQAQKINRLKKEIVQLKTSNKVLLSELSKANAKDNRL